VSLINFQNSFTGTLYGQFAKKTVIKDFTTPKTRRYITCEININLKKIARTEADGR